ncbi:TorD/DmsD family molecular chaperone [Desulfonatronovibrio hydrogenovorans]|uniref:TorD/DmsD family molecular chaperone n=1 Tax=Desulfonatronovibrio hydrogenovorans TaxID=53245 RepID=UPI00068B9785|nr:molecular chaperone TorD family protein [Desulfonatronovibrio hydrogenovorans]
MIHKKHFYLAATALRDFFIAQDAASIKHAAVMINESLSHDLAQVQNWRHVEYSFNQLFVGPKSLEAPPFASLYLEAEPVVMGRTTMLAREIYAAMGLASPWKNTIPEDHIGLELDAVIIMHKYKQETSPSQLAQLHDYFVREHMRSWIPLFCQRIKDSRTAHVLIKEIADVLLAWLDAEDIHWTTLDVREPSIAQLSDKPLAASQDSLP